ncbi:MAG TPA: class C sortase [Clostridiales bacterium]|nr:class C sortase [Clostridiales bacterium]
MKKHLSTILLALVFVIGLSLLIYPTFSDYWNSFHQSRAIASYTDAVSNMDDDTYERMWAEAQAYNRTLIQKSLHFDLTPEEQKEYEAKLDVSGTGMMGYVEIPSIRCTLPIYHGTNEAVLQIAIGHIEGSSLPVGGTGTHCVLSGHRGLPSAKLFTDLDQLVEGDTFMLHVLDETLTYEVDQILIVLPEEVSALKIEEDKDLCTLVTCTPYGVNTHRMLVRGHRIANEELGVRVTADAMQIDPMLIAPIVAAVILVVLLIWILVKYRNKKQS